jgi:hypothetical protein
MVAEDKADKDQRPVGILCPFEPANRQGFGKRTLNGVTRSTVNIVFAVIIAVNRIALA